jgi:hypothetical protein
MKADRLMNISLLITVLALAFIPNPILAYSQTGLIIPSPDEAMLASISPVSRKCLESRIEIRKRRGPAFFRKSYGSVDCEHGMGIDHGKWTPDSMFFVFNTSFSGGHQPWHRPIYFYSRTDNKIHSLDSLVGPIVAPEFELTAPHFVATRVLEQGNSAGRRVMFDLDRSRQRRHRRTRLQTS